MREGTNTVGRNRTARACERIGRLLDAVVLAPDRDVPDAVATIGMLADDLRLGGLSEWASQMWQAVLRGEEGSVRERVRMGRGEILAEAEAELRGRETAPRVPTAGSGRRASGQAGVGRLPGFGSAMAVPRRVPAFADPRRVAVLAFVLSAAAIATEVAYVVAQFASTTFHQLFQ